jgi:hypothetical protein
MLADPDEPGILLRMKLLVDRSQSIPVDREVSGLVLVGFSF